MALPIELSNIFAQKQKSYKMVLIQSLLTEMNISNRRDVSYRRVRERFLSYLQERETRGDAVDQPPQHIATKWGDFNEQTIEPVINNPIQALTSILEKDPTNQTIGFKRELYDRWDQSVYADLYEYAQTELDRYYSRAMTGFSIQNALYTVMNQYLSAKSESFAGHRLGYLVRQEIPNELRRLPFIDDHYKVQGSVGQGNWAKIPWLAIMDKRITTTTQHGEYIVYLFSEDMSSVYLTLAQGVTEPLKEGRVRGYEYLRKKARVMRETLPLQGMTRDEEIYLTDGGLGRDYQVSTIAYYRYEKDRLPDDDQLIADLQNVVENYKRYVETQINSTTAISAKPQEEVAPMETLNPKDQLTSIKEYIARQGFSYPDHLIENFYLSLKSKPFVILAGVSGTGKTKLVKLFAEAIGATTKNERYRLIPVRPDWNDPSDLVGYKDLSGVFRPGPLAKVLVDAAKPQNRIKPYFICLDEMNLARVEHYFSDLLSIIETQQWSEEDIITDPIIKRDELNTDEDKELYGDLYLPDNVYLVGTVNMDETTHPFSKKVLDRANTIEFNYINLTQYPDRSGEDSSTYNAVPNAFLRSDYLQLIDAYTDYKDMVERTTDKLVRINQILEAVHSHVGFRIRDAICFYMIYNERFKLMETNAAFDLQLLQKILPRIQGSSMSVKRVLLQMLQEAIGKKIAIGELMDDATPLFSDNHEFIQQAQYPQSARKLVFMIRRLEEDGFTSYWLS